MKKFMIFTLSFLVFFSSFQFTHKVTAASPEVDVENTAVFEEDSSEEFSFDEESDSDSYGALSISQGSQKSGDIQIQGKRDGDDAFELGFLISYGLLGEPVYSWHEGHLDFPAMSLVAHYKKHGKSVKAKSAASYLNKARVFRETAKKGVKPTKVKGETDGVLRYRKNGRYIDLAPDNRIVSFGLNKK